MSYSGTHETSNLHMFVVARGAPEPRGRAALQRCLRPAPIPDTSRKCSWTIPAQDSRESGMRLADGAQRYPRLQRAWPRCAGGALLPPEACPRSFRGGELRSSQGAVLHHSPREFGKQRSLWTLEDIAEVSFEEGLTDRRVSGETIRATLSRLGVRWERAKRWIESPDPEYERKKGLSRS
jgi:hypothetical protein